METHRSERPAGSPSPTVAAPLRVFTSRPPDPADLGREPPLPSTAAPLHGPGTAAGSAASLYPAVVPPAGMKDGRSDAAGVLPPEPEPEPDDERNGRRSAAPCSSQRPRRSPCPDRADTPDPARPPLSGQAPDSAAPPAADSAPAGRTPARHPRRQPPSAHCRPWPATSESRDPAPLTPPAATALSARRRAVGRRLAARQRRPSRLCASAPPRTPARGTRAATVARLASRPRRPRRQSPAAAPARTTAPATSPRRRDPAGAPPGASSDSAGPWPHPSAATTGDPHTRPSAPTWTGPPESNRGRPRRTSRSRPGPSAGRPRTYPTTAARGVDPFQNPSP